ncbi:DMT family transporter [Aestuariibacter sp. AA17]|uniref:DMT family transporter n=1 Tax=Fluctibacter corallii TaxID=2984329 RepID=A0ABT3AAL8_9ALTE|nr:DMT family transporter [Aestuariibacter sp. AA17]MCV2885720.1 DMT family transporter [Aestuariibacter sp. AA17]
MFTGEIAALSTALCWAVAARMFAILGRSFSPLALNFWKGLAAIGILFIITTYFVPAYTLSNEAMFWLLLSGVIGIGLGDTFFFQALNKIGDSQSILVAETLAPIFTALLAMAWISEWLTWQQWTGIALVILSVDMVVKIQKKDTTKLFEATGYVYAALAALCQAVGAVISRDILTSTGVDAFNASQIRLVGGMVMIVLLMVLMRQTWLPKTNNAKQTWVLFTGATVIGTFAALYLQMVAFANTKAAVVQTLFATSVILSLIVAKVLGERVERKTLIWSVIALIGVGVLVGAEHIPH